MTVQHSENLQEIATALAKAQAKVKGAAKDSLNPHFRSKYADLASVWDACRDALTSNGLSVVQFPGYADGVATLDTILLHSSGQWIQGTAGAPLSKQDAQGVGSALTYLRRYALAAVASVSPEDDDGNAATKPGGAPTMAELSEKPAALKPEPPPPWIDHGHGPSPASRMLMPFGKELKDKPLSEVPSDALLAAKLWAIKKAPDKGG